MKKIMTKNDRRYDWKRMPSWTTYVEILVDGHNVRLNQEQDNRVSITQYLILELKKKCIAY